MSTDYIDIVFDGPPAHESGRFVEVENSEGKSIKFGEWVQRPDGYWVLRIPEVTALQLRVTSLEGVLSLARQKLEIYRANSNGEYQGGMEYTALIKRIDATLSPSGPQEA